MSRTTLFDSCEVYLPHRRKIREGVCACGLQKVAVRVCNTRWRWMRKRMATPLERDGMQFLIDGESIGYLRGATLDFHDGLTGVGFHVVNPSASRTCGCGSSFDTARQG